MKQLLRDHGNNTCTVIQVRPVVRMGRRAPFFRTGRNARLLPCSFRVRNGGSYNSLPKELPRLLTRPQLSAWSNLEHKVAHRDLRESGGSHGHWTHAGETGVAEAALQCPCMAQGWLAAAGAAWLKAAPQLLRARSGRAAA